MRRQAGCCSAHSAWKFHRPEASVCEGCPPCTEKFIEVVPFADGEAVPDAVSDCTPGRAWNDVQRAGTAAAVIVHRKIGYILSAEGGGNGGALGLNRSRKFCVHNDLLPRFADCKGHVCPELLTGIELQALSQLGLKARPCSLAPCRLQGSIPEPGNFRWRRFGRVEDAPVPALVTRTSALGITAPLVSLTVPRMVDCVDCAISDGAAKQRIRATKTIRS